MQQHKLEILAPVGDEAMLRAAVFSGADCVYLGVGGFNARTGATGWRGDALRRAVAFCHARGCGVYAALNTLVLPDELPAVADAVREVADAGCDAVIVQDLAVALAVQRYAPGLELHASTQASVHSLEGVLQMARLGFTRVILSRELREAEIAHIAANSPIELEVFVHGALCVCVSGQCTMSSFLGGRSANRGACAGPCRLPFTAQGQNGPLVKAGEQHHLSLKDLSVLDALPHLQQMGVASAKIEGRLRGPEYTAAVVDAARKARDGESYDKRLLADVFSRSGFTDGWFTGTDGTGMFGTRTAENAAAAKAALPAVHALYRREMPRVPVRMQLVATQTGVTLTVQDEGGHRVETSTPGSLQPANQDATEGVRKALAKTGGTPFYISQDGLQTDTAGWHLPNAMVNALRRDALQALLAAREAPVVQPPKAPESLPLVELVENWQAAAKPEALQAVRAGKTPRLRARLRAVAQLSGALRDICEELLLPLDEWEGVPTELRSKTRLWLPRMLFGGDEQRAKEAIQAAQKAGFTRFEAGTLAGLSLCGDADVSAGFGCNTTNADSLRLLTAMGASSITLSVELTLGEMASLVREVPAATTDMLCYGHLPLMVTRAQPLANAGREGNGELVDRRGKHMPVHKTGGVSSIHNPVPLWVADRLAELPTDTATLYFTNETAEGAARIAQDAAAGKPFAGEFTRGLYDKGIRR